MNNTKKECPLFKISSVAYMWIAVGCGFIAFLMMFCPAFYNACTVGVSGPVSAANIFFGKAGGIVVGAWQAFIGYMLVILAFVAQAILALPFVQPTEKQEKIVLFSSLAADFIGLILVSLIAVEFCGNNGSWTSLPGCWMMGGTITFIVFDVLGMGATSMAIVQDW